MSRPPGPSHFRLVFAAALLVLASLSLPPSSNAARMAINIRVPPRPMPEFPHATPEAWINSEPIRLADLKGHVVLIEIWTTV